MFSLSRLIGMMVCVNGQSVSIVNHLKDGPLAMPVRGYLDCVKRGEKNLPTVIE